MDNIQLMPKTDAELIQEYIENKDKESFESLLSRYIKEIHRFVVVQIGFENMDYSFDIVQDVSIKIWKSIHMYNSKKSSFKTWVYNITKNACIDFFRSKKLAQNTVSVEDMENVLFEESEQDDDISEEVIEYVKKIVNKLDQETRVIFFLKIEQNLTFKEIGEIIHRPTNTVKSIYLRTIDKIRNIMSKE